MKCDNCGMNLNGYETSCPNCGKVLYNQNNIGQYNNQQLRNQIVNTNGQNNIELMNDKMKKIIIVGMLMVILLLLSIIVVLSIKNKGDLSNKEKRVQDGSRTIMLYLEGSNLESENKIATIDLESLDTSKIDLNKMNVLVYTGGTEKWHNDYIKNDENAIFILKDGEYEKLETYDKKNMGDADTLKEFLDYCYSNYETQYYDLILYDHGGAIEGAIYDDFTKDHLSLEDFDKAFDTSLFNENNKIDTVLFMTCLNGTIEVAATFSPYAKYLISSEEITNGGEFPQLNFLNEVSTEDDAISYGKKFITHYEEVIDKIDPLGFGTMPMYSIVDLSKVDKVVDVFNDFIDSIDMDKNYSEIVKIRSKMYQYAYTLCDISQYDMVDLYSLVEKLDEYSKIDAKKVIDELEDAIVFNWSRQEESHGLSVYFPYKAKKSIQNEYLKIYKKLDDIEAYYKFIDKFNDLNTSKSSSSFASFSARDSDVNVDGKEFKLKLTEEQMADYADAIYIIFEKNSNGLYNPIFSSNKTSVSDGVLRTNLDNSLIKLYDKNNNSFEGYLSLIERVNGGVRKLLTNAVLFSFNQGDGNSVTSTSVTVYFDNNDGNIKVSNYFKIDSEAGTSGQVIDSNDYEVIDFISSSYDILDNNGNYKEEWDNKGVIGAYEIKVNDMVLKEASLDDGEYYCVFKIFDIYGNVYYSKLLSID